MRKTAIKREAWGVLWRTSGLSIDGEGQRFMGSILEVSLASKGFPMLLFASRNAASAYIKERWGYIARRPDLHRAPHGWRMPIPAKVEVSMRLAK